MKLINIPVFLVLGWQMESSKNEYWTFHSIWLSVSEKPGWSLEEKNRAAIKQLSL